jgi:calcineurin-like phosphoesterase family protein
MKYTIEQSPKIWFTSDPHLGHAGIVYGTTKWQEHKESCRRFDTVEEHDNWLLNEINYHVKENDILFLMGDFAFVNGNIEQLAEYRKRIRCKTVHLILGNHDHELKRNKKQCRELFTSVQAALEIVVAGQKISLSHYAHRVWNQSHRGAWMLYGHSHDSLEEYYKRPRSFYEWVMMKIHGKAYYKTTDIGMESAKRLLGAYRPFNFMEIDELFLNRINTGGGIDHHE